MSLARDVALRAGVSTATVSRVLNGSGYVSPELRDRVEKAVEELGYEANALARSLRSGQTRVLGLVLANLASPSFALATRTIEEHVAQAGYNLVLCATDDDPDREHKHLVMLRHLRVDGIIACPCGENDDQIASLASRGVPMVLLARRLRRAGAALDTVVVDGAGGAARAVEHLISLGHRRIGLLPGPLRLSTARDLLAGYWRAMTRQGQPFDDTLVEECVYSTEAGRARTQKLLRVRERPTALVVGSDTLMLGVLHALRDEGVRVPNDIALVGCEDCSWAEFMDPPLTVLSQPARDVGLVTARLLLERVEAGNHLSPREIVLPSRLIIRQSCGGAGSTAGGGGPNPWLAAVSE